MKVLAQGLVHEQREFHEDAARLTSTAYSYYSTHRTMFLLILFRALIWADVSLAQQTVNNQDPANPITYTCPNRETIETAYYGYCEPSCVAYYPYPACSFPQVPKQRIAMQA